MNPVQSGGIPPAGKDFNGILYRLSMMLQWYSAGGFQQYDSAFATDGNVGGYPKGAVLLKATQNGFWFNTVDNNSTNPDTGGAGWQDLFTGLAVVGGPVSQFTNDAGYLSSSGFAASLGSSGYQKLPSGMILQWGIIGPWGSEGAASATFPIAFPTACLNATVTITNPSSTSSLDQGAQVISFSKTTLNAYMQVYTGSAFSFPVSAYWQAIGY